MTDRARDVDRLLRLARWLGVVFCALQFTLYTPSPGLALPFPRLLWLPLVLPLVAVNLLDLWQGRRLRIRWPRSWPAVQLSVDCGVTLAVVWMFAFDPGSALWALLLLPVLEGALRDQLRGALLTWAGLSLGYLLREFWAAATFPYVTFYLDSVTYRLGIAGIVAAATGTLAGRLRSTSACLETQVEAYGRALAETQGLRQVAAATHRMTSLDGSVVLREVTTAASRAGFEDVRLHVLDDGEESGIRGDEAALVDRVARASGTLVLPEAQGGVVGVPVRSGDATIAVLLGRRTAPVQPHQVEALELLAAQAGAALANARRYDERRSYEEQLARQALTDALTGLPNRTLFTDRVTQALARRLRSGSSLAVLLLDLDRFKDINDTLGHQYGDGLLRQVAERLSADLRAGDTVARLGGDEFALLAVDLSSPEDGERLAARVLDALARPFVISGVTLDVDASVGVALAPEDGLDVDSLLRCADVAMYTAKRASSGLARYDRSQDEHTPERLALLGDLRRALEDDGQLALHYQPKIDLALGELVGVEALLRWRHPARGPVSPGEFIPAAEGTGLIHRLTAYVLEGAVGQVRAWADLGLRVPVSVNLSTRCLLDVGLPDAVGDLLDRSGVPADLLCLEITESAVMADPGRAAGVLQRLHDRGVQLSIDDFGTGYSSMSYLRRLPLDELKVDRSFVLGMQQHDSDAVLVRSVIELGHNLGLAVVAEGVEDAATLAELGRLGCDVAQGYHLGRPAPAEELTSRLLAETGTRAVPSRLAGA